MVKRDFIFLKKKRFLATNVWNVLEHLGYVVLEHLGYV